MFLVVWKTLMVEAEQLWAVCLETSVFFAFPRLLCSLRHAGGQTRALLRILKVTASTLSFYECVPENYNHI